MSVSQTHYERIAVRHEDGITELRVHTDSGPLVWDATVHRELTEAFDSIGRDPDTKVLIITGTGDEFCTELDVASFAPISWDHIWWEGRRMLRNLNDIDVPVIGVVNGPALIHSEIPVMGDIVLAAPTAEFADRAHFPLRDTIPGDGVNLVWADLLGPTRLKYWLLTGAAYSAEDGLQIGFVNEVHEADRLLDRAWEIARELGRRDVAMLRYAKSVASMGFRTGFVERLGAGLGIEGSGHWYMGGLKSQRLSGRAPET